jgi:Flp pilus assembly protein TadD
LKSADPDHYALPDYHGEFAAVLEALGNNAEAREQLELAAQVQRHLDGNDCSIGVTTARYFLADHLLRHGEPEQVLDVISPSLAVVPQSEWLLRLVQAQALHALSRTAEARWAAQRALEAAPSDQKRVEIRAGFEGTGLLGAGDA